MQFLYYYDYLLTLPDEVPFILYRACNPFTAAQINYAWKGRKTWSESMDPHGVNCADRTSLLDLHTRELVCFSSELSLTTLQNRYTPIIYQTWLFFGSRLRCF